ncbi:MAG: sulfatase, partial [Planctomycetota bacterium]
MEFAETGAPARETLFGEIFEHDVADLDHPQASLLYRWCIDGWWKLVLPKNGERPELYDLQKDPFEKNNLAATHPETVVRLTDLINQWWS